MPFSTPGGGFTPSPGQEKGVFQRPLAGPKGPDHTTGQDISLGTFVTTAYGPPWNAMNGTGVTADGTDLRPNKKVYGVAVDPKIIPMGSYLHIWPNPFGWEGTFKAFDTGGAIKGKRIDFYDWRGRSTQMKWGRKNATVRKADGADSKIKIDEGGGISLPGIPNPLNAVDDMASAVKSFVSFLLSPKSLGGLLAKVAAMFLKLFFRALWDYVVAPIFHWHQRAVLSYFKATDDKDGLRAVVTISFWATGYAILWAKVDGDRKLFGAKPQETPLGSMIRATGNTRARRSLVKPKDVKKRTPTKPEPVRSRARIARVGTMTAARRRTVQIGGSNGRDELPQRTEGGVGIGGGAEVEAEATRGTDAT